MLVDQNIVGFDERTQFFSYVDLVVQILAFLFQFVITSRLVMFLGMPRTGTTIVSYLLDCDPRWRSLLNMTVGDNGRCDSSW